MKELRDYLNVIKRYLPAALVLLVVVNAGVYLYVSRQKPRFEAMATLYVNRVPEVRNSQYYTYEGYYAGLASKEYTDVVVGLLKSTDITRLAAKEAGLNSEDGAIEVKKVSPQLISVVVSAVSPPDAEKLLLKLAQVTSERSKSLAKSDNQGAEVSLVNPEPLVSSAPSKLPLYLLIASISSLLIFFLAAVTREYFKS